MKKTMLAVFLLAALLLSGCGYMVVEDAPTVILMPTVSPAPQP